MAEFKAAPTAMIDAVQRKAMIEAFAANMTNEGKRPNCGSGGGALLSETIINRSGV